MPNEKELNRIQIYGQDRIVNIKQPEQGYSVGNRPDKIKNHVLETLVASLNTSYVEYVEFHSGEGKYTTSNGEYKGSSVTALQVMASRQKSGDITDFHAILHEIRDCARDKLVHNVARFPAMVRNDRRRYWQDLNKWIKRQLICLNQKSSRKEMPLL